jgi:hypothetical protein
VTSHKATKTRTSSSAFVCSSTLPGIGPCYYCFRFPKSDYVVGSCGITGVAGGLVRRPLYPSCSLPRTEFPGLSCWESKALCLLLRLLHSAPSHFFFYLCAPLVFHAGPCTNTYLLLLLITLSLLFSSATD